MAVRHRANALNCDPSQGALQELTHAPTVSVPMFGPSGRDRTGCALDGAGNDAIVVRADRVFYYEEFARVRRSVRKQVHELHAAHSRPSCVAHTSADRLVVNVGVSRARVQQHEEHPGTG